MLLIILYSHVCTHSSFTQSHAYEVGMHVGRNVEVARIKQLVCDTNDIRIPVIVLSGI